jgi:hypothetical protein
VFSVLPLLHGRLWLVSLALASLPLMWRVLVVFLQYILQATGSRSWIKFCLPCLGAVGFFAVLWPSRSQLCDERFSIYSGALHHWPELIAGGRMLRFSTVLCDGTTSVLVSMNGGPDAYFVFLHNVLLDVMATVGFWPSLPLLMALILASSAFVRFFFSGMGSCDLVLRSPYFYSFWCFLAALIPQWLFQPIIYGDGLLYYLSYATLGALVVIVVSAGDGAKGGDLSSV